MRNKTKLTAWTLVAGLALSLSPIPAQASSLSASSAQNTSLSLAVPENSNDSLAPLSNKQINAYLDALAQNFRDASRSGDAVASKGLKKLNGLSSKQKRQLAVAALSTAPMESTPDGTKIMKASSSIPVATPAAASKTLRQPVACYQSTSVLGVPLTKVKIASAVWSKNGGRTLVKVENPTARISYNYDPVMTVNFSGHNSWKSNNSAYFEVDVTADRKVGWAGSGKGMTLHLSTNSYGVQKSCRWVG